MRVSALDPVNWNCQLEAGKGFEDGLKNGSQLRLGEVLSNAPVLAVAKSRRVIPWVSKVSGWEKISRRDWQIGCMQ